MALIVWNQNLSVDIKSIDEQHKKLISMLNDFYDNIANRSNRENIAILIDEMKKYAVEHFSYEEKYMIQFDYYGYYKHKEEHSYFIAKVNEAEDKYVNGKSVLSLEMASFLFDWLKQHIQGTDKKYVNCFIEHGVE